MKNYILNLIILILCLSAAPAFAGKYVHKYVLENGLTVLVRPVNTTQNVTTQIVYKVGSKDEAEDEKGLAHWLEHMCFKGTQKMSEVDVDQTCVKLSGSNNAYTSYDNTRYFIDLPVQHWYESLPILADMMTNCTFKQDLLNAELQVVIQEMKNGHDSYGKQVLQSLMSVLYPDHPYHYPVIGYKSDLETLSREKLIKFYKKHYIPNNAVLVVVGNVDPDDVYHKVVKEFGHIPPDFSYTHKQYHHKEDVCAKSITLYRNIQKPVVFLAYEGPGLKHYRHNALSILRYILTGGQSSRLYRKLVEGKELVHSIGINAWSMDDSRLVFVSFEPKNIEYVDSIIECIQQEFALLETEGPTQEEVNKILLSQDSSFYNLLESNHSQASAILQCYLLTGNEDDLYEPECHDYQEIKNEMQAYIKKYLRRSVTHKAFLMPLPEDEKTTWKNLQERSNQEDLMLMTNKARQSPVEDSKYAHTIVAQEPHILSVPKPQEYTLSNGIQVLYYHNANTPKIELTLDLKFSKQYEPKGKEPLADIHNCMLLEGTKNYTKETLFSEIQKRGISISLNIGSYHISTLNKEIEPGLEYLTEILTNPLFEDTKLEKYKKHALTGYEKAWDDPHSIMSHLMSKHLYDASGHYWPTTPESIASITLDDVKTLHATYITPYKATVAIAGDLSNIDLISVLEKTIGTLTGPEVTTRDFFNGTVKKSETEITHHIEREQVILGFIGLSVNAEHPDYQAHMLFNRVLDKKLFRLRESSNAFYSINGSVNAGANKCEPGEVYIKTQVSQTRLLEAQNLILNAVDTLADEFSEEDLKRAQQSIANDINNKYSTNSSLIGTFLSLYRWNRPHDYYVTRAQDIKKITVQEVRDAVKRVLNRDNLSIFKVGPVNTSQTTEEIETV